MSRGDERSAEQREAARLERERRRQQRRQPRASASSQQPLEPPADPARELPAREVRVDPASERSVDPASQPQFDHVHEPSRATDPPIRVRRQPASPVEAAVPIDRPFPEGREPYDNKRYDDELFGDEPYDHEPAGNGPYNRRPNDGGRYEDGPDDDGEDGHAEADDEFEVPVGTRRVARSARLRSGRQATAEPSTASRQARRTPREPRAHSRARRIVALLVLVLGAALIWFIAELFQPFHGSGHGTVTVAIPPHMSSRQIGDLLERDGVVASGLFFELRATLSGQQGELRSGTYRLKQDMSYASALKVLTTPPTAAKTSPLTLTEGRTRRSIDSLLRSQGIRGSYFAATRRSRLLDPTRYGAPRGTNSLEGFLFPSTYQLRDPISIAALIADQLSTFRQRFATVNLSYARSKRLTPYDVLIIASMIEREAATARDRFLVASVIYNRLADGMPLQIDATSRYQTGNYTKPLTVSELNSPSPYNTRIHKGLPPTPIGNPGLASIQAAAHPANTNYLYFVVLPCGNGKEVFTSDYAQFLADAQSYQSARARNGGRSPAHC